MVLALGLSCAALAQESPQPTREETKGEAAAPPMTGWMLINFVILVFGLGYLVSKSAPAIFRARQEEIRGGIEEAERRKKEADARSADIDRRLEGFAGEIDKIRQGVSSEMSAEAERIRQETARLIQRIEGQARQEIGFMTKAATQQLKTYSADLALDLAQRRIQERMSRETQQQLVGDFIAGLGRNEVNGVARN